MLVNKRKLLRVYNNFSNDQILSALITRLQEYQTSLQTEVKTRDILTKYGFEFNVPLPSMSMGLEKLMIVSKLRNITVPSIDVEVLEFDVIKRINDYRRVILEYIEEYGSFSAIYYNPNDGVLINELFDKILLDEFGEELLDSYKKQTER